MTISTEVPIPGECAEVLGIFCGLALLLIEVFCVLSVVNATLLSTVCNEVLPDAAKRYTSDFLIDSYHQPEPWPTSLSSCYPS